MVGCTVKFKRLYALSQVPAVAHVDGAAPLPVTAVGFCCLVALRVWGFVCLWARLDQLFAGAARRVVWSAGGLLSCFRLELGEDAFFPRVEGKALHVTAMPLVLVYLERVIHTCSAPCTALITSPKPHLQRCVGSLLSSVQSFWSLS